MGILFKSRMMVESIWEIGLMENKMELGLMSIKTVQKEKDFGNKEKESSGLKKHNKIDIIFYKIL